jgi:hypothetical protein
MVITGTSLAIWSVSLILAAGVGWSRYEKKKTREKLIHELMAMDMERREKLLDRLNQKLAMELRQALMERSALR